jgi:processive 1,2-diacylglycerol beta-glucosyltransferase
MAQRILVLSASVGAGHLRAAQAVELALRELAPHAIVRNLDVLTMANTAFRRMYGTAYLDLVNHAPHMLGLLYDLMDKPRRPRSRRDRLRLAFEELNLRPFLKLLQEEHWDVVVNTHFLPAEIIAHLRRKGKLSVPQITATTDFETHRLWVNQPCDVYTTATEEGRQYLAHWGVPLETIHVTGIPIHPVFTQEKSCKDCQKKQGVDCNRPVILQLAGGFGVGPIGQLYQSILAVETPIQLVVVCGKNAKAKEGLAALAVPARHRVKLMGFTDQIDELMAAADVVVSKPGGLTTSEVLARGAAMMIVNPIPGQESRNSDYLLESQAAVKVNNIGTLAYKLESLLSDRKRLEQIKANARRISKPRAAFDVAEMALAWRGVS